MRLPKISSGLTEKSALPVVTIGLPVQNGERYLERALESLLNQDYTAIHVLISDNASTDKTSQICLAYASRDQRVKYVRRDLEVSAFDNFRLTLEACNSPFFMWAAHDDEWDQRWIGTLVPRIDELAIGAFGRLQQINENGHVLTRHRANGAVMSFANVKMPSIRLLRFLIQHESAGKANLIYSIFRTQAIKLAMQKAQESKIDFDCAHVYTVLQQGRIVVEPSVVFKKRVESQPISAAGDALQRVHSVKMFHLAVRAFREHRLRMCLKKEWDTMMRQYVMVSPSRLRIVVQIVIRLKWFQNPFLTINQIRTRLVMPPMFVQRRDGMSIDEGAPTSQNSPKQSRRPAES